MSSARSRVRELAQQYRDQGDETGWFEVLYQEAQQNAGTIPWADMTANPNLLEWLSRSSVSPGQSALVVGCGLGDDAEALAERGFRVTAFDIAPSAIAWCGQRFPSSSVQYTVADLCALPGEWRNRFDFVFEAYTLQVLTPPLRREVMHHLATCVAPGGTLLVVTRGRDAHEEAGALPWPLTREELTEFSRAGLTEVHFEDYIEREDPPVRRFRLELRRPESPESENSCAAG